MRERFKLLLVLSTPRRALGPQQRTLIVVGGRRRLALFRSPIIPLGAVGETSSDEVFKDFALRLYDFGVENAAEAEGRIARAASILAVRGQGVDEELVRRNRLRARLVERYRALAHDS